MALLAETPAVFDADLPSRIWLLGVTPEIALAPWPSGLDLIASDRVMAMIDGVWPGNTKTRRAICADWVRAPFAPESFDLVIGDGCLTAIGAANQLAGLLASLHRCVRPDGHLMLRLFCRPETMEHPDAVIAAFRNGEIPNFHAFKWRLAMALQGETNAADIAVDDIWRAWNAAGIDMGTLARIGGWGAAEAETIAFYRGSTVRYSFARFDETIDNLRRAGFDLVASRTGSYDLAERCPHVLLKKRMYRSGDGEP